MHLFYYKLTIILLGFNHVVTASDLFRINCTKISPDLELENFSSGGLNEDGRQINILLLAPVDPSYFSLSHQTSGVCLALKYAEEKGHGLLQQYNVTFYKYQSLTQAENFNGLSNILEASDKIFTAMIGPIIVNWMGSGNPFEISHVSNKLGLNILSYGQGIEQIKTKTLTDGSNIFQLAPALDELNGIYLQIFLKYEWDRAAIIWQSGESVFRNAVSSFKSPFATQGIDLGLFPVESQFSKLQIEQLVNKVGPSGLDHNVLIIFLKDDKAAELLCEFYKAGMHGRGYIYFGMMFWDVNKWEGISDCTFEQYTELLSYSLYVKSSGTNWEPEDENDEAEDNEDVSDRSQDSGKTALGVTVDDYLKDLSKITNIKQCADKAVCKSEAHYYDYGLASDATWCILNALYQTHIELTNTVGASPLLNYKYTRKSQQSSSISRNIETNSFDGISGKIEFSISKNRSSDVFAAVYQLIESKMVLCLKAKLPQVIIENTIKFRDNYIPNTNRRVVLLNPKLGDFIILIPSALGVAFCLVCITIILLFRRKPGIKILSPKLNAFGGTGSLIAFSVIFLYQLVNMDHVVEIKREQESSAWDCILYEVLIKFAFYIALGSMIAKQYRVHRIFISSTKKPPNDQHLALLVAMGSLFQLGVTVSTIMVDRPYYKVVSLDFNEVSSQGESSQTFITVCQFPGFYFEIGDYFLTILIMAIGLFFSWTTRNIKVKLLNEGQKVTTLVLSVVALQAMQVTTDLVFSQETNPLSAYFSITQTTLFIHWIMVIQIFVPGIARLIRRPNWKPEISVNSPGFEHKHEMTKYLEDISQFHEVDQILDMYVKTCEMWCQMKEKKKDNTANNIEGKAAPSALQTTNSTSADVLHSTFSL